MNQTDNFRSDLLKLNKRHRSLSPPRLSSAKDALAGLAAYFSGHTDSDASIMQVLGMLGSVKGKRVMELGAGIGRFTGDLGAQAKSVLALDFMQRLIEENERKHGHMGNISFRSGDACELEAEPESFEVVFTNWLLMYLGKAATVHLSNSFSMAQ